jgi:DNA-binding NarL/FixJ family response regulator
VATDIDVANDVIVALELESEPARPWRMGRVELMESLAVDAIRRAAAGGMAFGIRPPGNSPTFTARELDVIRLVVEGSSNDEIAARLGITAKTVESHLRRLFERLGTLSRTELATRALREGWLEVPPAG